MRRHLSLLSGLTVAIAYALFSFVSWTNFPTAFSPLLNWLSDLGSYRLNPHGAIWYNAGIIVAGLSLLPFFLGMSSWAMAGHKTQNIMLFLTQFFGTLGSLAMVMSALFPITIKGAHAFWSASLFILLGTAFSFSVAALRYYSQYPRWLLFLGIFIAVEDMFWGLFQNTYFLEWLTVALFLLYVLLVGIETRRQAMHVG